MAVICGIPYQERKEKMNGDQARIIGAAPAAVTLRIFNKDSGEEHATQVIHDTLLLNKCFLSYAAPQHQQLIKAAFDSFHWKKSCCYFYVGVK